MNRLLLERTARREQLILQAAAQRGLLAQHTDQLRVTIALADKGLNIFRFVKKHRVWITSGSLLLLILKPASIISPSKKWLRIGWFVFQILQKVRDNNKPMLPRAN